MRNLQKNFSHSFDGKVWNIESEVNGDYLVIEVRNEDSLTAAFFTYNTLDHSLSGSPIILEETWWVGITGAVGKVIIFHTFTDTENPQQKSFFAWDIEKKKVIWAKTDISLVEFGDRYIRARREDELIFINMETGEEEATEEFMKLIENKRIRLPFHYVPDTDHYNTVSGFLRMIGMDADSGYGIDYLEVSGLVILSYYLKADHLENRLIVIDTEKRVLLKEKLGVGLKGIADRPFFVYGDSLIFVKDYTDFFSYQLSQQ
ncbi:MAG: DUF4905 domain-containing protein [Bacteroidota bacterium]